MITLEKQYCCFICKSAIQRSRMRMYQHSRVHNMTMQEMYEKEYGLNGEVKQIPSFNQWKDQCEFRCFECEKMFHNAHSCRKHVKEAHKLDADTYKLKYGLSSMMTKEKHFTCFLCNKSVQWSNNSMVSHSKSHKMTLKEMYEKEHGLIGPSSKKR